MKVFLKTLQIDAFGPCKIGLFGMKYIHVAICVSSKFCILHACKSIDAEATADFIINQICCTFGLPETIITDQGTNYTSGLIKELTKRIGIKLNFATAHHHQTVGTNERLHGPLANYLSMYVNNASSLWPKYVKCAQMALNCSPSHALDGQTPYFIVFGMTPRTAQDINWNLPCEYVTTQQWLENLHKARELCVSHLNQMNMKMAAKYNKGREQPSYKIGQLVLVHFPQSIPSQVDKFTRKYRGPYRVVNKLSALNYEVTRIKNGSIITYRVHVDRMKPFKIRASYLVAPRIKIRGHKRKLYFLDYE